MSALAVADDAVVIDMAAKKKKLRKKQETSLGINVKRLREAQGMTQLQLSESAGVTCATISVVENHPSYTPRFVTIQRLAEALGVTAVRLLEDPK